MLLTFAFAFQLSAQTHHIGLNFGVNQLLSIDEGPPFGKGSPWSADLGYGMDLSYYYVFNNGLSIGANLSVLDLRFQNEDQKVLLEDENVLVQGTEVLKHYYLNPGFQIGYYWQPTARFGLHFATGLSRSYYFKQVYYLRNYEETRYSLGFSKGEMRSFMAVQVSCNQSYTVIRRLAYRLNLISSIRYTHYFDYLNYTESIDRILPQAYLGVELELGRRRR